MSFIDIFAAIVLLVLVLTLVAAFVAIGAAPGYIAKQRNHPWAEAVQVAGWVTLICGFIFWPFALVWAFVDVPRREGAR
jgi:hypothetical protein